MLRRPIPLGKNGDRAIRPARIGTTRRGCSVISPRMWLGIAISGVIARCGNSLPSSEGFPELPSSAKCSRKSAARISRWLSFSASIRSTAKESPSCWRRCASTPSRSPRSISAIIGADHLKQRFLAAGGNADTFKYQQRKGVTSEGIPYIVEFAFGLHQSGLTQGAAVSRKFITGANWSVGINNPFRAFGSTGEGLETTLAKVRANASSPVICALHLASAYVQYADRGKSSIILTDNAEQPDD